MEFTKVVNERFSCRDYSKELVTDEKLDICLDALMKSPSAMNKQPYKIIVVRDHASELAELTQTPPLKINKFTTDCKCFIVIIRDSTEIATHIKQSILHTDFTDIDIGIAAQSFCLTATDQGLATCIIGWFNEKKVKTLLAVPKTKKVKLIIAIGHPNNENKNPRTKKSKEKLINLERFI